MMDPAKDLNRSDQKDSRHTRPLGVTGNHCPMAKKGIQPVPAKSITYGQLEPVADAILMLFAHTGPDLRYHLSNQAYAIWFNHPIHARYNRTIYL